MQGHFLIVKIMIIFPWGDQPHPGQSKIPPLFFHFLNKQSMRFLNHPPRLLLLLYLLFAVSFCATANPATEADLDGETLVKEISAWSLNNPNPKTDLPFVSSPSQYFLQKTQEMILKMVALKHLQSVNPQLHKLPPLPVPETPVPPRSKKLLLLDLDETLVHTSSATKLQGVSSNFSINSNQLHVFCRPHLTSFLARISRIYDVAVFTAGERGYANPILDHLEGIVSTVLEVSGHHGLIKFQFKYRLFREQCIKNVDGVFVKDLAVLENLYSLKDMVLVDNSRESFSLQPENGVHVSSWFFSQKDSQLVQLYRLLKKISLAEDVRLENKVLSTSKGLAKSDMDVRRILKKRRSLRRRYRRI